VQRVIVASDYTQWHTHTHTHSVELPWTRDQPVGETSTWRHTTITRDKHDSGGIRTRNSSKQAVACKRRDHWDRHSPYFWYENVDIRVTEQIRDIHLQITADSHRTAGVHLLRRPGGRTPSVRQELRVFKCSEPCRHYRKERMLHSAFVGPQRIFRVLRGLNNIHTQYYVRLVYFWRCQDVSSTFFRPAKIRPALFVCLFVNGHSIFTSTELWVILRQRKWDVISVEDNYLLTSYLLTYLRTY